MITTIDARSAGILHKAADTALKAIAAEHGLIWEPGKGTFYTQEGKFAIKGSFKLATVGGVDRERFEFERDGVQYGMKPEHYKARFQYQGEEWELLGFSPKKPRFCVSAVKIRTGQKFGLPEEALDVLPGRGPRIWSEGGRDGSILGGPGLQALATSIFGPMPDIDDTAAMDARFAETPEERLARMRASRTPAGGQA